jgi:hypothetical protein
MEYTLLQNYFSFPKFALTLRTLNTSSHKEKLVDFDLAVKGAVEAIRGSTLLPIQWELLSCWCKRLEETRFPRLQR